MNIIRKADYNKEEFKMNNKAMNQEVRTEGMTKQKKDRIISTGMLDVLLFFMIFTLPQLLSGTRLNWNFKECFYTPNLFTRTGASFWKGFLFELPHAFGRWINNTGFLPILTLMILFEVAILFNKKHQGEI